MKMEWWKAAVPQEPLGKDGKQTLTLPVMVLKEACALKGPTKLPAPRLWDHTHADTCSLWGTHTYTRAHTHTHT